MLASHGREGHSLTSSIMDPGAHKKPHQYKKCKSKAQERFAKNFPYRFCWLTEPNPESLQPWEVKNNSEKDQLPLQKKLVPTRSIPVPGVGAPDFTSPSNFYPPPPRPPLHNLWELKLLGLRFPKKPAGKLLAPHRDADHSWTSEETRPAEGPSQGPYSK